VSYIVPGMTLIPQKLTMSCWYASAQMLIQWRRDKTQMSESDIVDPSEDPGSVALRDSNKGVTNPEVIAATKRLGLTPVPPMSPGESAIESWLQTYGPLWTNGKTHIVVLAGIQAGKVLVYDPAPVNVGKTEWRTLAGWYVGSSSSSRDTGSDVRAVFLHCPG